MTRVAGWVLLLFLVLPAFVVVPVSFTDRDYLSFPEHAPSLTHYADLWASQPWRQGLWQSVITSVSSSCLATVLGTLCAIGCWRIGTRWAAAIRWLMLTPVIVPSIVHALGFYRFWIALGLIDTYTGVILAHVILGLPYVVITVSSALANFDRRLEQAGRSLGASTGQVLRRIILPSIAPGVLAGFLFAFITAWDEIVVLLFITSRHIRLLPRMIWDGINDNIDPAVACVASLMIALTLGALLVERAIAARKSHRASVP
jgi:putative spermidine/putrescine transport system permease protein